MKVRTCGPSSRLGGGCRRSSLGGFSTARAILGLLLTHCELVLERKGRSERKNVRGSNDLMKREGGRGGRATSAPHS